VSVAKQALRIGVTLHLRDGFQSIWKNGALQNVVFLAQLLRNSPLVGEVMIVHDQEEGQRAHEAMQLDSLGLLLVDRHYAQQNTDVIIEFGAQFSEEWHEAYRARGGRTVWMRIGNDFVIDAERAIFELPNASLRTRKVFDAVWTIPEYEHSCLDYFVLTTRAPVKILPHLWTPQFFEAGIRTLPENVHYGYQGPRERWRLCCFEPNVCMVKTCLVPLLIGEEFYRNHPASVEILNICNTTQLRKNDYFVQLASMLDVVRHSISSFDDRFPVYDYLARRGDAVISHHWENGQNYLYYEVLYGGYPLIHNSEFIRDLGYFYPGFDVHAGAVAIQHAREVHDQRGADYRRDANRFLATLDVAYEPNVRAYTAALQEAVSGTR
jgi:hypothetical protein